MNQPDHSPSTAAFTLASARRGFIACLPLALGAASYGLVYGVLAAQAGLTWLETAAFSGLVLAGASQFMALEMWTHPLPATAIITAVFIINLRHLLMGASLTPWLTGLTRTQKGLSLFVMTDENWALTLQKLRRGEGEDAAYLFGSGVLLWFTWVTATVLGQSLGGLVTDPAAWGLDFSFVAAFIALAAGMWTGKSDLTPWLVAAGMSILFKELLPGKWYILIGGLAGSLVGLMLDIRRGEVK